MCSTTGEATWDEALLLYLERSGFTEETYHTFSYSPLADDDGTTNGMLCVVAEVTNRVIGERQLARAARSRRPLAASSTRAEVMKALKPVWPRCRGSAVRAGLSSPPRTRQAPDLAASHGLARICRPHPHSIDLETRAAMAARAPGRAASSRSRSTSRPERSLRLPPTIGRTAAPGAGRRRSQARKARAPVGYLVAGLNPHRSFDADYRGFIELLTAQVAAAIAARRRI